MGGASSERIRLRAEWEEIHPRGGDREKSGRSFIREETEGRVRRALSERRRQRS